MILRFIRLNFHRLLSWTAAHLNQNTGDCGRNKTENGKATSPMSSILYSKCFAAHESRAVQIIQTESKNNKRLKPRELQAQRA